MEINSLSDVINKLKLDVYKRVSVLDLKNFEKEIDPKVYEQVNQECTEVINSLPPKTYINQPKNKKFFLPPIPGLLKQLGTTIEDELTYRAFEEDKMQNEEVEAFACDGNILIIVTKTKDDHKVYYTYNYDYINRHEVILMSRVEYGG